VTRGITGDDIEHEQLIGGRFMSLVDVVCRFNDLSDTENMD
jgi:hypothetical protein